MAQQPMEHAPPKPASERPSQERRQHARQAGLWSARLTTLRGAFGCEVLDVSLGGARLRLGMPLTAQQPITLSIEGLDPIHAEVVWQGDPIGIRTVGVRFTDATAYVSAILARLPPRPAAP